MTSDRLLYFLLFMVSLGVASSFYLVGSVSPTKLSFLVFVFCFVVFSVRRQMYLTINIYDIVIFIMLLLALLSQYYSRDISYSKSHVVSYFYYVVFYFLARVYFYNQPQLIIVALKCLVFAVLISCFLGIVQFLFGVGYVPNIPARSVMTGGSFRACGLFDDPNYFGMVLSLIWPLSFTLGFGRFKSYIFGVFLLGLLCTMSRASILILLIQFLFILYFFSSNKLVFLARIIMVSGVSAILLVVLHPAFIFDRMLTLLPLLSGSVGSLENSSAERIDLLFAGVAMIADHLWYGVGFGNFQLYSADYMTFHPRSVYAHNTYITVAAELGVVSFCVWLLSLGWLYFALKNVNKYFAVSLLGMYLSYFFLVANYFQFLAFFLGIVVSYRELKVMRRL